MTSSGQIITEEMQEILWVEEVMEMKYGKNNICLNNPLMVELPLSGFALVEVVKSLMNTVHHNTMAGIFTIGMCIDDHFVGFSN